MKKILILLLAMTCISFCACHTSEQPDTPPAENATKTPGSPVSPAVYPLEFASWKELQNAFAPQNENNLCSYFSEQGAENKKLENIRAMVGKIQSGIPVLPCLDGNLIELRNETGFPNVVLFPSELYDLPWLWYFPACSGKNFYIQIACLPDGVLEKDSAPTASDVIKKLSPGSPNLNNLGMQHKAIYQQELKLRDRTVTALITEYKSSSRNSIAFVYGELLVIVRCDPAVWSPEWFSALSFVPFTENAGS